jgi:Tol biopolymer transport system component
VLVAGPVAVAAADRLEVVDAGTGAVRVLVSGRVQWDGLQPTPDGRAVLAFQSDPQRSRVRRRIDLATGRATRLPVVGEGSGTFSPDGTRVFAPVVPSNSAAALRTIGGRRLVRLRPRYPDLTPTATWSPDGRLLAITDQQDETRTRFRVRLLDARTGRVLGARAVTGGTADLLPQSFSPAADRLVIPLSDPGRSPATRTVVLDLRTGATTPLGAPQAAFTWPAWSPDGTRIALALADGGVAVLDAATGATVQAVTTPGGVADRLAWSPDATRLAYRLLPAVARCIACIFAPNAPDISAGLGVADVATGAARLAVPRAADVLDFAWARDGRGLVVDARR